MSGGVARPAPLSIMAELLHRAIARGYAASVEVPVVKYQKLALKVRRASPLAANTPSQPAVARRSFRIVDRDVQFLATRRR